MGQRNNSMYAMNEIWQFYTFSFIAMNEVFHAVHSADCTPPPQRTPPFIARSLKN